MPNLYDLPDELLLLIWDKAAEDVRSGRSTLKSYLNTAFDKKTNAIAREVVFQDFTIEFMGGFMIRDQGLVAFLMTTAQCPGFEYMPVCNEHFRKGVIAKETTNLVLKVDVQAWIEGGDYDIARSLGFDLHHRHNLRRSSTVFCHMWEVIGMFPKLRSLKVYLPGCVEVHVAENALKERLQTEGRGFVELKVICERR